MRLPILTADNEANTQSKVESTNQTIANDQGIAPAADPQGAIETGPGPESDIDENHTTDDTQNIVLTEEMMKILKVPYEILGEAMYKTILQGRRQIIHLDEELSKRDRHIEALQKRVMELNKQIESLNFHISKMNMENRKPKSKDAIATLGQIATISTLRRK